MVPAVERGAGEDPAPCKSGAARNADSRSGLIHAPGVFTSPTPQPPGATATPLNLAAVQVAGALDKRIRLSLRHLLAERARILGGEGFGQAWGADQHGRWIGAVALAAHYLQEPVPVLAEV